MAASIIGYPQSGVNFCPVCASSNFDINDCWNHDGLLVCSDCGCRCHIIAGDDEEEE